MNKLFVSGAIAGMLLIGLIYFYETDVISLPDMQKGTYPDRTALVSQPWRFQENILVYGDQDAVYADAYKAYAEGQQERSRRRKLTIQPASLVQESDLINQPAYLIGTGESNTWLRRMAGDLPYSFASDGFQFAEKTYADSTDVLILVHPNPLAPHMPLYIILGNSDAYLNRFLESRFYGDLRGDYQIFREGQCIVFGMFGSNGRDPWYVDKDHQRDYTAETDILTVQDQFRVITHNLELSAQEKANFISRRQTLYQSLQSFLGNDLTPVDIHLYSSFEDKGIITNNTDLAHNALTRVDFPGFMSRQPVAPVRPPSDDSKDIHMLFRRDIPGDDGACEAQIQIRRVLGKPEIMIFEAGLSVYFTESWRGKGYAYWASRLYLADTGLSLKHLLIPETPAAQSELVSTPLAGTLVAYLIESWGMAQFKQKYKDWVPDDREIAVLEKGWHAYLAGIAETYQSRIAVDQKRYTRNDAFQKGFCYAHEGYQIYNGYLSRKGDESIQRMASLGTNAISLTPFTSMQTPNAPQAFRLWQNVGGENDESLIHAALSARSQGMRVMMKPHILVSRGWPGDIEMKSEADWDAFFDHYYQWIQHYALLSEMYDIDILCAGVEMGLTTVGHEDRWRAMVKKLRKIYSGPMVYAPNWGWEFEQVSFWDDFDYIGVNSYYPLSESAEATDEALELGAKKVADRMETIARKYGKSVLITEMGYKSSSGTWIKPYDYRDERILNIDHQARAYEAMLAALADRPWLKGIYWWKWSTQLEHGGHENDDFTPNGKPAEQIVSKYYKERF